MKQITLVLHGGVDVNVDADVNFDVARPLLVVGMIGMIHPNGDESHPKAPCHWDEIHPNGWRLLAPLG